MTRPVACARPPRRRRSATSPRWCARMRTTRTSPTRCSLQSCLRIVWGGDATVGLVRESPLAPSGVELVFPNRYSLAVIDAQAVLADPDPQSMARNFVNDSFWFGQLACSSPRSVVWCGTHEQVEAASAWFWPLIEAAARRPPVSNGRMRPQSPSCSPKTTPRSRSMRQCSPRAPIISASSAARSTSLARSREHRAASSTSTGSTRSRTLPFIRRATGKRSSASAFRRKPGPASFVPNARLGIDRIVKPGAALNFDVLWDGVDLLTSMTRLVSLNQL